MRKDSAISEDSFLARKNAVETAKVNEEGFLDILPTEQERKTRDLITLKRSQYEMDEYVKMVQVRNICQESLNTLLDKFNKSDSLARKNKNQIAEIDVRFKSVYQQLIGL